MRVPFVAIAFAAAPLLTPLGTAAAVGTRPTVTPPPARGAAGGATPHAVPHHHPDFNGDGYADVVAGVPNDNVGPAAGAGSTWVIYGGAHGANSRNRHVRITESTVGHGAASADADNFGWVTAWGDFNHDGFDDLAIGAPGTTVSGQSSAGEVVVLYGTASGLHAVHAQVFTEAIAGLHSTPQLNDYFGLGLAAGDFNHDGYGDLAIDAGGVGVHAVTRSGRVTELFGTRGGLSHASPLLPRHFDESTPGIHGGLIQNDDWGRTLAAADFNGDGYADLAVGAPKKAVGGTGGAGVVDVLYGGHGGLSTRGAQTWTEDTTGVPGTSRPADEWGWTLAVADFDGDHRSDLVIGAPTKLQGTRASAGAATLLHGSRHGLTAHGAASYALSNITFGQAPAAGDELALSLAPLDFDADGRPDLALGVPGRTVGGHAAAGEVVVLHNVGGRLSRTGGFVVSRSTPHMIGPSAANERFGLLLAPGDFSGNGAADLAVSLPGLTVGGNANAGGVQVLYGARHGFATNDQLFDEANPLGGTAFEEQYFGGLNNPAGV